MLHTRENLLTENERKEREVKEQARKQKEQKLQRDLNTAFGTAEGMNALRFILEQAGLFKSPVIVDPKTWDVKDKAMIYNSGRVSMYLAIRKYLSPEITKPVENQGLAIDESEFDIFT